MFAGNTGSVGHISICDDVVVSAYSYVSKDIREPGVYTASFPAEKDRNWKRNAARFRRLDDIVRRINKLEKGSGRQ
jgi:UDP-3-O-[3-hydroxymyristoyl] glucosamine N-acyltransferase